MFVITRFSKHVALNALLFFAYFSALVWVNNSYLYPLYANLGATSKMAGADLFIWLAVLAVMCSMACGEAIRKPGDVVVTLLAVIVVPHALVLNGANIFAPNTPPWSGVSLAIAAGTLIIMLANKIHFRARLNERQDVLERPILMGLFTLNVGVLALIFYQCLDFFSFDYAGQYERRVIAREVFVAGTAYSYIASIGTQGIFPVLFALGVYKKQWGFILLGVANALVLWGAFGQKYPFAVLLLMSGLMLYFRRFQKVNVSWIIVALSALLLVGALEQELFGYSYLNDYFLRRVYIVPATLLGAAQEFSLRFGANYYSDTLLGLLWNGVRDQSLTFRLGSEMLCYPAINANVNFLAIAYLHMSYAGVLLESLAVAAIVIFMNLAFLRHGVFLALPITLLFATKVLEQSLLTVMLGSGICLMLLFLVFTVYPLHSLKGRKR